MAPVHSMYGIYAYIDPKPPQLIGKYGSLIECLGFKTQTCLHQPTNVLQHVLISTVHPPPRFPTRCDAQRPMVFRKRRRSSLRISPNVDCGSGEPAERTNGAPGLACERSKVRYERNKGIATIEERREVWR